MHKSTNSAKKSTKEFSIFGLFWHIFGNIYKFCFSQWLSATNKKSVCRSDSVQQTKQIFVTVTQCNKQYWNKYPISLWHVTKELEKKKTSLHIWISPLLSNCFGVPLQYYCTTSTVLQYYCTTSTLLQYYCTTSTVLQYYSTTVLLWQHWPAV